MDRPLSIATVATVALLFLSFSPVQSQLAVPPGLVGTWSSKSNAVFTGPDFYNPVDELLHEPRLTGTSFSFTADGFYEEAIYQAIANPANPKCPKAIMQFQHGTFTLPANGSIILTPFAVDGRQLWSDPCVNDNGLYTRYNQTEAYRSYEVLEDHYRGQMRLNLYKFDGAPMAPMYLAYSPPQMLPTVTLNPTVVGSTAKPTAKARRSVDTTPQRRALVESLNESNLEKWWYVGVGSIVLGSIGYFCV